MCVNACRVRCLLILPTDQAMKRSCTCWCQLALSAKWRSATPLLTLLSACSDCPATLQLWTPTVFDSNFSESNLSVLRRLQHHGDDSRASHTEERLLCMPTPVTIRADVTAQSQHMNHPRWLSCWWQLAAAWINCLTLQPLLLLDAVLSTMCSSRCSIEVMVQPSLPRTQAHTLFRITGTSPSSCSCNAMQAVSGRHVLWEASRLVRNFCPNLKTTLPLRLPLGSTRGKVCHLSRSMTHGC